MRRVCRLPGKCTRALTVVVVLLLLPLPILGSCFSHSLSIRLACSVLLCCLTSCAFFHALGTQFGLKKKNSWAWAGCAMNSGYIVKFKCGWARFACDFRACQMRRGVALLDTFSYTIYYCTSLPLQTRGRLA